MEPFSALAVATSAVQFVDFTSKIIAESYKLHTSTKGQLEEHASLEQVTKNLRDLTLELSIKVDSRQSDAKLSESDIKLQNLCKRCYGISTQLLEALEKLKLGEGAGKWKSFRQALRSVWSREYIEGLEKQLDSFRQQLVICILVSLRNPDSNTQAFHRALDGKVDSIAQGSESLGKLFLKHVSDSERWRSDLLEAIRASYRQNSPNAASASRLLESYQGLRATKFQRLVLHKLRYREILDRYERISDAHKATLQWIYENSNNQVLQWQSFSKFLMDDSSIYWITGKAGSGKSTLMKYLSEDPRTRTLLCSTDVAQLRKLDLVQAGFFFWNSGTYTQMSRTGLLRTLLHQCLEQCEDLFPVIFPDLWEAYYLFESYPGEDWTWLELVRAFRKLLHAPGKWFFFLIDGLDELDSDDGSSTLSELIEFLKSIAEQDNVKMCIASRPWVIFEDSFKHSPSLKLEDLTYPDIKKYVRTNLQEHPGYRDLEIEEPQYAANIVEKIARKSAGVFLWVTLVVASLSAGITNGDRISDLDNRLAALPGDLEDLFSKILSSLDPLYKSHACRLFMLVRLWNKYNSGASKSSVMRNSSVLPLTLLQLYFADLDDIQSALDHSVRPLADEEKNSKRERMRRRVNSRCKGLLESSKPLSAEEPTVEYLHRTVKDFIEKEKNWNEIVQSAGCSYDPNLGLCASFLLQMKITSQTSYPVIWGGLNRILHWAQKSIEFSNGSTVEILASILDNMDFAIHVIIERRLGQSPPSYAPCMSLARDDGNSPIYVANLLDVALHYGLDWYIKKKIAKDQLKNRPRKASVLVYCAVKECRFSSISATLQPPGPKEQNSKSSLVKMLLEAGEDPNCGMDGETALDIASQRLSTAGDDEGMWLYILRLLTEHGANATKIVTRVRSTEYLDLELRAPLVVGGAPSSAASKPQSEGRKREKGKRLSVLFKSIFRRS